MFIDSRRTDREENHEIDALRSRRNPLVRNSPFGDSITEKRSDAMLWNLARKKNTLGISDNGQLYKSRLVPKEHFRDTSTANIRETAAVEDKRSTWEATATSKKRMLHSGSKRPHNRVFRPEERYRGLVQPAQLGGTIYWMQPLTTQKSGGTQKFGRQSKRGSRRYGVVPGSDMVFRSREKLRG